MDFNMKQWREEEQQLHESDREQTPSAKLPRLILDTFNPQQQQHEQPPSVVSSALPLFVTEPNSKLSSNLSAYSSPPTSRGMTGGSGYFSLAQWQELELQALIYRHMLAGAAVPPELLHLVQKSLINSSHHPYFLPHLQPSLLQSGYWGRAPMDPEPGRCRRTDGKKWRCSRDVVVGKKYCERHMHRGRNRSRKPVEIASVTTPKGGNACGGILKTGDCIAADHPLGALGGGGTPHFDFSGPSPSFDLLHLSQRSSDSIVETQNDVHGDDRSSGQILRHFFDDWPRSVQESENARNNCPRSVNSTTNLSISISGHPTSDFSLKLSTGDGDDTAAAEGAQAGNTERERSLSNWGVVTAAGALGANQVASMGGPLAEALRSSTSSNSSPTSVLHQLRRCSASETSYIST